MTKKAILILLALLLISAVGVVVISAEGNTQHIDMTLTGEIINLGDGAGLFDVDLRGSPGQASARGLSFSYPVEYGGLPEGNRCANLGEGRFSGLVISSDAQINMSFNDGSMLFANGADMAGMCVSYRTSPTRAMNSPAVPAAMRARRATFSLTLIPIPLALLALR